MIAELLHWQVIYSEVTDAFWIIILKYNDKHGPVRMISGSSRQYCYVNSLL